MAEPTGASVDDAGTENPKGRRRVGVLLVVAVLAFLIDLGSKLLVVARLENHAAIKVIGDVVTFQVIRNSGAAFGMGQALTVVFTMIASAVIVVIWRIARRLYSLPWAIALGLLLGGALGNLTDRLFRAPGVFAGMWWTSSPSSTSRSSTSRTRRSSAAESWWCCSPSGAATRTGRSTSRPTRRRRRSRPRSSPGHRRAGRAAFPAYSYG